MKVPYSILNDYVELGGIEPEQLVEDLNLHSVEATLEYFGNPNKVEKAVVGEILETTDHPSLKKLKVCQVNIGKEVVTICTNDKSVEKGQKVFLVLAGGKIGDLSITQRNFKGIVSQGMFLSLSDLVDWENIPKGVFKFSDPNIAVGTDIKKILNLGEPIIELDITPNRGDLLSVKGLAREIRAIYRKPLKELSKKEFPEKKLEKTFSVEIQEKEECHRYRYAIIKEVKVKESPLELQVALFKFGASPINNVVDITNYILYTEGNPMHAFDLDKISGKKIIVRKAKEKEEFIALGGKKLKLSSEDLIIADEEKVLALAGIIGGEESSVSEDTKNILLEMAYFNPYRIRKTAKRLDLRTESSYRFERNVDIENIPTALNRAIELILRLTNGKLMEIGEAYPKPYQPLEITLTMEKFESYTGVQISEEKAREILELLGFEIIS